MSMYAIVNWEDETSTVERLNTLIGDSKQVGDRISKQFITKDKDNKFMLASGVIGSLWGSLKDAKNHFKNVVPSKNTITALPTEIKRKRKKKELGDMVYQPAEKLAESSPPAKVKKISKKKIETGANKIVENEFVREIISKTSAGVQKKENLPKARELISKVVTPTPQDQLNESINSTISTEASPLTAHSIVTPRTPLKRFTNSSFRVPAVTSADSNKENSNIRASISPVFPNGQHHRKKDNGNELGATGEAKSSEAPPLKTKGTSNKSKVNSSTTFVENSFSSLYGAQSYTELLAFNETSSPDVTQQKNVNCECNCGDRLASAENRIQTLETQMFNQLKIIGIIAENQQNNGVNDKEDEEGDLEVSDFSKKEMKEIKEIAKGSEWRTATKKLVLRLFSHQDLMSCTVCGINTLNRNNEGLSSDKRHIIYKYLQKYHESLKLFSNPITQINLAIADVLKVYRRTNKSKSLNL